MIATQILYLSSLLIQSQQVHKACLRPCFLCECVTFLWAHNVPDIVSAHYLTEIPTTYLSTHSISVWRDFRFLSIYPFLLKKSVTICKRLTVNHSICKTFNIQCFVYSLQQPYREGTIVTHIFQRENWAWKMVNSFPKLEQVEKG